MRHVLLIIGVLLFFVAEEVVETQASSTNNKVLKQQTITSEQRAKIMRSARKLCRDKHGPGVVVARLQIQTKTWKVWCAFHDKGYFYTQRLEDSQY